MSVTFARRVPATRHPILRIEASALSSCACFAWSRRRPRSPRGRSFARPRLIAVDVQVVDKDGVPVECHRPEAFSVSINGRERRVLSAEFVRQASLNRIGLESKFAKGTVVDLEAPSDTQADCSSWPSTTEASSRARFVRRWKPPSSLSTVSSRTIASASMCTRPERVFRRPSIARPIRSALANVTGERWTLRSRFNLRPSEIVDITAALGMGIQTRQNTLGSIRARRQADDHDGARAGRLGRRAARGAPRMPG